MIFIPHDLTTCCKRVLKCFILCIYKCKSRLILERGVYSDLLFFLHENNVCFLKMILKGFKKKHFNRRKIVLILRRLITISQNFFVRMSDIFIL